VEESVVHVWLGNNHANTNHSFQSKPNDGRAGNKGDSNVAVTDHIPCNATLEFVIKVENNKAQQENGSGWCC
jgi:hypothetical protein